MLFKIDNPVLKCLTKQQYLDDFTEFLSLKYRIKMVAYYLFLMSGKKGLTGTLCIH